MSRLEQVSKLFYLIIVSLLISLFVYLFLQTAFFDKVYSSNAPVIYDIMLYYLIFILGRAALHLLLSFLDYLFTQRLPEPEYNPLVTVLMPCYNEEVGLVPAVESVMNLDYPNIEILIVDDGSQDSTLDIAIELASRFQEVRVITQANSGKAAALNFGVSQANGDYILCMDSDSLLSRNCIKMAIKYFMAYPALAAVAGGVHVATTKNVLTWFQSLEYIIGLNFFKSAQSALSIVPIVPGPIGVFKKECVLAVGGYKSDTFAEDADLSMRILMAGFEIKYCAAIRAVTEAPDSTGQLLTQRYRWSRGMIQTIRENIKCFHEHKNKRRAAIILSYMFFETILIPLINFIFALTTLQYALLFGDKMFLGPYFMGLTILDMVLSLYSIVMEKKMGILFVLSLFNRVTYGLALEIVRFFSLLDEVFNLPMKWGEMKRKGIS